MKLSELISISPGFHRSVSVKLDLTNPDKIASYIPTDKADAVIEHVASALLGSAGDGAVMLVGSYGTGKSHLATFIAGVAGKTVPKEALAPVAKKLRNSQSRAHLGAVLRQKPHLIVPLSGSTELRLDQQLLVALKRALDEHQLAVELESSFTSAVKVIERWRSQYPVTYDALGTVIGQSDYPSVDALVAGLSSFESKALNTFTEIYPQLTAGASFDVLSGEVTDVYQSVCLELVKRGYAGIMIVFDEFNKVMDTSVEDGLTLKTMQDLAELASRVDQGYSMNLIVISHRTISQYVDRVDALVADEWRKIEGRFRVFDVSNQPWETYALISRVLVKDDLSFFDHLRDQPAVNYTTNHRRLDSLFEGLLDRQIDDDYTVGDMILQGCIPLHPVTVFLLPRVSSRLAQNERTLFTFLVGKDSSPVAAALDGSVEDFRYILPWQLYDYFDEQLSRSQDKEMRELWTKVTNALETLPEDAATEATVLKTIGIYQLAGTGYNLPCTVEMIQLGLAGEDATVAIESLVSRKLVFVKQSTGEIDIIEPADFDAEKAYEEWMQEKRLALSPFALLERLGLQHYIIPQRYNHLHGLTRYLTPVYGGLNDLKRLFQHGRLSPQFDGLDGVVCYLFPESDADLAEMRSIAASVTDQRVLLVLPASPILVRQAIWRAAAFTETREKLKASNMDKRVQHLAELHLQDAIQDLDQKLSAVIEPSSKVMYFWDRKALEGIVSERTLSNRASEIMENVYSETPVFRNELINKTEATVTSRRARNDVIDTMLADQRRLREKLRSAQERFMLDTLFVTTGLYDEDNSVVVQNWPQGYSVLETIEDFFCKASHEQRSLTELINALKAPPYGIRDGVIPALLALCILRHKTSVAIRDAHENDCPINAALLDKVVNSPESYFVKWERWGEELEDLKNGLIAIFSEGRSVTGFFPNQFSELGYDAFKWFSNLPRYARETNDVSEQARALRRIVRGAAQRPRQALLIMLPRQMTSGSGALDVDAVLSAVQVSKAELESALGRLLDSVMEKLRRFLSTYGDPQGGLIELARGMVKALAAGGVTQEWSGVISCINGFRGNSPKEFARQLAQTLTGVRLEDWLDSTVAQLDKALERIQTAFEQVAAGNENGPRVELAFYSDGTPVKLVMPACEVSTLGSMLQSQLEYAVTNFGNNISVLERRQILLNILKKSL